jgi:hypothetical protein
MALGVFPHRLSWCELLGNEKLTGTDMVGMSDLASVESVTQGLSDLTCSNHTSSQLVRKHSTKHVPSANVKCKLPREMI